MTSYFGYRLLALAAMLCVLPAAVFAQEPEGARNLSVGKKLRGKRDDAVHVPAFD